MKQAGRRMLWLIAAVYLAVLLRITVFRSDFLTHPLFREGQVLLIPFVSLYRILRNSVPMFVYLLVGNLVWFVPLGLLLPILTGCGKRVVLWGLCLSLFIECGQFVFGTGVTEVEDLILNTAGTWIGWVWYRIGCRVIKRRHTG